MRQIGWCALALAVVLRVAAAQSGGHPTQFEVASIKPAAPQDMHRMMVGMRGGPGTPDPGQVTYTNVALRNIIMNAYGVKSYQITGPGTLDSERFDVMAKVPKGATKDDLKVMLQNLLAERFQLKLHHDQKELPMYSLVVGKNGPKLKEAAPEDPNAKDDGPPALPPGGRLPVGKDGAPVMPKGGRGMMMMITNGRLRLTANGQPISSLADMLSNQLGRPVVDQTGLTGKYDISLEFQPEEGMMMHGPMGALPPPSPGPGGGDSAPDAAAPPNLFTAVQEQLGLKLEPKKGPVDILVIDHIEKAPTEN